MCSDGQMMHSDNGTVKTGTFECRVREIGLTGFGLTEKDTGNQYQKPPAHQQPPSITKNAGGGLRKTTV
jgi:hypothetical protein